MTRGNRLTNEELEEIRERAEKATKGNSHTLIDTLNRMSQAVVEDIPKLLANIKQMATEIERLEDRLRDVEILYNECSTELDSYYK